MALLGVLFSLDEDTVRTLLAFKDDASRLEYLQEEIEEKIMEDQPDHYAELDKSWDALHRSLTDGKLGWDNGTFPLNHVVFGGLRIYEETDYVMSLKTPEQVIAIAEAVSKVTESAFRAGYQAIDPEEYGCPVNEEDFTYTWDWFQDSVAFWDQAASERRYVLFTVDQ